MSFRASELAVIVVTYRSLDRSRAALESLRTAGLLEDRPGERLADVVVCDSKSGDGTPEALAREFPGARVVTLDKNGGFAYGVNHGMRMTEAPYVLLLNPDAEIDAQAVIELAAVLDADPETAAVGPRIVGDDGMPHPSAFRFPTLDSELTRTFERIARRFGRFVNRSCTSDQTVAVDWVSGACMMIRRSAWDRVGRFDDAFFLYFEETDWCRRAHDAGLAIKFAPGVSVRHAGGASASASGRRVVGKAIADVFRRSRRRYFVKHFGRLTANAVSLLDLARRSLDLFRRKVRHA